jgi:ABC-2 type transport system permease protein
VIGPASYYILEKMGRNIFLLYCFVYSLAVGGLFAGVGYRLFKKRDLL